MPKKPHSSPHPLREIRIAAGKTQQEFAEMLGVSRETILSIEGRRMKMPSDLALKVRIETGCCLKESTKKRGRRVFDVLAIAANTLKKYSPEDFAGHRQVMNEIYSPDATELLAMCQGATRAVDLLMHVAGRRGGAQAMGLLKDLENFLAKSFESYGLRASFRGYLEEKFAAQGLNPSSDILAMNFPLAPIATAYPFPSSVEESVASEWMKAPKSDAKVMPGRKTRRRS